MSSFFLLPRGVQILYPFNQKQAPRFDSTNLEPPEPIFYPQLLEPRHTQRALAERKGTGALWTCPGERRIRARTDAAVVCALAVDEEALLGPFRERIAKA